MSLLTAPLPESIQIDNKIYNINTDFGSALKILIAFENPNLSLIEKQWILLKGLYKSDIPLDLQRANRAAIKFLDGKDMKSSFLETKIDSSSLTNDEFYSQEQGIKSDENMPLFSFEQDAPMIVSAMMSTYGINLTIERDLHWWVFLALFADLSDNCLFSYIVDIRRRKRIGKLNPQERKWYTQNKNLVDLKCNRNKKDDEEIKEFLTILNEPKVT